jgi:hypothetical protein
MPTARPASGPLQPAAIGVVADCPGCSLCSKCRQGNSFRKASLLLPFCFQGSSFILHPSKAAVTLAEAEREHILGALRETGWVVAGPKGAAARLGMKRSTLQEKMRKLGISRPQ